MVMVLSAIAVKSLLLFWFYLAYCAIWDAKKRDRLKDVPWVFRYAAYGTLLIAVVLDAFFNITVGSLLFLDIPREWMFTSRCQRWMHHKGWRGKFSRWICKTLNAFQEGHC